MLEIVEGIHDGCWNVEYANVRLNGLWLPMPDARATDNRAANVSAIPPGSRDTRVVAVVRFHTTRKQK